MPKNDENGKKLFLLFFFFENMYFNYIGKSKIFKTFQLSIFINFQYYHYYYDSLYYYFILLNI